MKILYNPNCSKCVMAKDLLDQEGQSYEVVEYLNDIPSEAELNEIIGLLGIKPIDLIRKGESVFKEKYEGKVLSDDQCIKAMLENPILIERPIIIEGNNAVIGRPPSKVLTLIK